MNCFNGIQNILFSELQKAEYYDYLENLPFTIISSSTMCVFPVIIDLLKLALTDKIFQIQKAQIDICFEYYSRLICSNGYDTCDKIDDFDNSNCLEDHINKRQIALKSLINCIGLMNILEIWEVKHIATNTTSLNYISLLHDNSHI
ncbi:27212_t:CDS:2, partial [Racocetra persica]